MTNIASVSIGQTRDGSYCLLKDKDCHTLVTRSGCEIPAEHIKGVAAFLAAQESKSLAKPAEDKAITNAPANKARKAKEVK